MRSSYYFYGCVQWCGGWDLNPSLVGDNEAMSNISRKTPFFSVLLNAKKEFFFSEGENG